jgi:hypothetical protein
MQMTEEARQKHTYPVGGWANWQTTVHMQRCDQGQDFEIPIDHWIHAPGHGEVINHLNDRPFPNGFGSPYLVVKITSGRFTIGTGVWYIGHANKDLKPVGHKFSFGDELVRANNSLNSGWGWVEIGYCANGVGPGSMGEGCKHTSLFTPLHHA